jgi:hypothetical protein
VPVVDKTDLLALIQGWTGLTPLAAATGTGYVAGLNCGWAKDPNFHVNSDDAAAVWLSLRSIKGNGIDDTVQSFNNTGNPATSSISETQTGQRDAVLSIRVEMYDLSAEAAEILDKLRTRFGSFDGSASLNAIGLAWQGCEGSVDLPTEYDNRVVSVASMDVRLSALASYVWTSPVGTGWVDTVVPPVGTFTP